MGVSFTGYIPGHEQTGIPKHSDGAIKKDMFHGLWAFHNGAAVHHGSSSVTIPWGRRGRGGGGGGGGGSGLESHLWSKGHNLCQDLL